MRFLPSSFSSGLVHLISSDYLRVPRVASTPFCHGSECSKDNSELDDSYPGLAVATQRKGKRKGHLPVTYSQYAGS